MMEHAEYDVAIAGASIAGATAATLLGRRGLRVALLERRRELAAYKKICTHFIQPSANATIDRLGLTGPLRSVGAVSGGVEIWTRWGWIRSPDLPSRFPLNGFNIRREVLDPMLRTMAARTEGVDLLLGHTVEGLTRNGRGQGVAVRGPDGATREVRARLVVGADGRGSHVAELAGLSARTTPHRRFSYFAHYRDLPLASGPRSQFWLLEPDVAYAFPNDDGVTVLACMPARARLPDFKADLEDSFARMFESLPAGPPIRGGERITPIMGQLEMPNEARGPTAPDLALIGDAALAADPLWGVGCGWAFQSAEWLVDATADALAGGRDLGPSLERYARRHRSALAGHQFLMSDYATGRPYNPIERLMYSAAARDPWMARHVMDFGARHTRVRNFLAPTAIGRAVAVNLRHTLRKPTKADHAIQH